GSQPDPGGDGRRRGDEQLRMVRGTRATQVVFGKPDPVVSRRFGLPCGFQTVGERVLLGGAGRDRAQVDDGQLHVVNSSRSVLWRRSYVRGKAVVGGRHARRPCPAHRVSCPSTTSSPAAGRRTAVTVVASWRVTYQVPPWSQGPEVIVSW